jgi:hypothetical protein
MKSNWDMPQCCSPFMTFVVSFSNIFLWIFISPNYTNVKEYIIYNYSLFLGLKCP